MIFKQGDKVWITYQHKEDGSKLKIPQEPQLATVVEDSYSIHDDVLLDTECGQIYLPKVYVFKKWKQCVRKHTELLTHCIVNLSDEIDQITESLIYILERTKS